MADSNIEQPAPSIRHRAFSIQYRVTSEDILDAVDREALARKVVKLLKEELRIQRDRLGHRGW